MIVCLFEHGIVGGDGFLEDVGRRRQILDSAVEGGRATVHNLLLCGSRSGSGTAARRRSVFAWGVRPGGDSFVLEGLFDDGERLMTWRGVVVRSLALGTCNMKHSRAAS